MTSAGKHCTLGGIQNIYYGKSIPNIASALPICEFLQWSLDEWFLGSPAKKFSVSELKEIVGEMIEAEGGTIPDIDPSTLEIDKLLSRLKSVDAKQQILRMIKGYVELEERGE